MVKPGEEKLDPLHHDPLRVEGFYAEVLNSLVERVADALPFFGGLDAPHLLHPFLSQVVQKAYWEEEASFDTLAGKRVRLHIALRLRSDQKSEAKPVIVLTGEGEGKGVELAIEAERVPNEEDLKALVFLVDGDPEAILWVAQALDKARSYLDGLLAEAERAWRKAIEGKEESLSGRPRSRRGSSFPSPGRTSGWRGWSSPWKGGRMLACSPGWTATEVVVFAGSLSANLVLLWALSGRRPTSFRRLLGGFLALGGLFVLVLTLPCQTRGNFVSFLSEGEARLLLAVGWTGFLLGLLVSTERRKG